MHRLAQFMPFGDDTVRVYVKFIFLTPSIGTGRWDAVNSSDCHRILDTLNFYLSNLQPPNYPLPSPYTPQFINDTKIRLVYKSIEHKVNDLAYSNFPGDHQYNSDPHAINMIWGMAPISAEADGEGNEAVFIDSLYTPNPVNLFQTGGLRQMVHELGHCLGLFHSDLIKPGILIPVLNPTGNVLAQYDVNDFWIEDTTQMNHPTGSNNFMSYTWDKGHYFSPKQIGKMHYTLRVDPTVKQAVQSYGTSFNCDVDHNQDYTVLASTTETWTADQSPLGNVTVESGGHLIISACINMSKDSKIIVKSGAKLSVINGRLTSRACGQWKGIEVWGIGGPQTITSSDMPLYNGMIYLENAVIANAETGILIGKPDANGNPLYAGGGGIIFSQKTKYINNKIAVNFFPFLAPNEVNDNIGIFKLDTFSIDAGYYGTTPAAAGVKLKSVQSVDFLGCYFSDVEKCTATAIKCIDGSVNLKDHCSAGPGGVTCSGIQTRNSIIGFQYGIHLSSLIINIPSLIDHVAINQKDVFDVNNTKNKSLGGIYISNNVGTQVVNCSFSNSFRYPVTTSPIIYGLYLDNCLAYVVENNSFTGYNTVGYSKSGGVFVNNSGPNANSIYNNTFNTLTQGLWAQNENYEPVNGTGLVMNCNDFSGINSYNIGVQSIGSTANCLGCPPATQNAGIAVSQGVTTQGPLNNARNTYSSGCAPNKEAKFYVDTQNPFVITSHGSFQNSQFHVGTQLSNSCSNPLEIVDIFGLPAPNQRANYCPSNYMPSFSSLVLNQNISDQHEIIYSVKADYLAALDNGNTAQLLTAIDDTELSDEDLKKTLMDAAYLSDTVLKTYFTHANVPLEYLQQVFTKNAPLHPRVWQIVPTLEKTEDQAIWDSIQYQNKLSTRIEKESVLSMAYNEIGLINNEKIRRFLNDSTGPLYDSIINIYNLNELPQSRYKKAAALIAFNRSDDAQALLDSLAAESPANSHFCTLLGHILKIRNDLSYADSIRTDTIIYNYLYR